VALSLESHFVGFRVVRHRDWEWITRPHDPGEPARHVAELSELANFRHTRGNVWRYEPGATGRRHRHRYQEETFVVLSGILSMYVGEPPERHDIAAGELIHVEPGTPLQAANHGDHDLVVYAYGYPPESDRAEILTSVV
jgi:quercetin dioxygenase-like cupin family protein